MHGASGSTQWDLAMGMQSGVGGVLSSICTASVYAQFSSLHPKIRQQVACFDARMNTTEELNNTVGIHV
jgi:hypothetical protein